ncbi:MAG: integral rane sensor signal transduction histidine kinase [Chthoniobacteraceae bacterium]|nr:integral rane sensor signal transduction histidine kinase [Chthoniobacteraceae bacterium]
MNSTHSGVAGFRARLAIAMTLLALVITGSALYFAQQKVAAETEHDFQTDFHNELAALHEVQEIRHAVLAERCRSLVRRPRIHAALEDNALDLLYLSAQDELRDIMEQTNTADPLPQVLQVCFYRFLDATGAVISPETESSAGALEDEFRLTQSNGVAKQQLGYLKRRDSDGLMAIIEVLAMPIISSETGEPIAALVLGFRPVAAKAEAHGMKRGIWLNAELHLPELNQAARETVALELPKVVSEAEFSQVTLRIEGKAYRLFCKRLNPDSTYPAAYEVCLYPLGDLLARQRRLIWQAALACGALMLGGVVASHLLAVRLSAPVERLAIDSEEHRTLRKRAETALEMTSAELQRAARFSADASHQLKTPATVLRAGLENLLARERLSPEIREELAALVHQTFRLTSIVEDLLLLSRMDAGQLRIHFTSVDLAHLIDGLVDDLSALPDAIDVAVETDCESVFVAGEKCYVAIILQNLLENARKYNRPGGRIRLVCRKHGEWLSLTIGNTGAAIPAEARKHIFERFHRATKGENVPGHGLGLNLARELARLHGGDLRLAESEGDWTAFEVRFRLADIPAPAYEPA